MSSPLLRPSNRKRILFFLIIDLFVSYFTLSLAYNLRFSFEVPLEFSSDVKFLFLTLIAFKIISLALFRVYLVAWRFFGLVEALRILYAHLLAYGMFFALMHFMPEKFSHFPQSVIATDFVLSAIFIGAIRISKRVYLENVREHSPKVALIFGGSTQATNLIKSALSGEIPIYPIAIVDNNPKIEGTYIANLRVYPMSDCRILVEKHKISTVVLTKEYAKPPLEKLFKEIHALGITDIKIATTLKDDEPLKDVSIEDLLSRPPKDLDRGVIKDFIFDKTILITGGGGSIGSEIARQCVSFGARRLILLDHSEYNLYAITEELQNHNVFPVMMSILEKERLSELLAREKPDILLHAAAYKHVPLCETNTQSAVENNVLGSKNVIDCAIMCEVPKIVIISTDKAVRPTNVMGATKRVVELYAQNVDSKNSEIVAVRFGNVLGSSGSVVPKFRAQIEKGGPLTVTHPEITRYFMLIPEACRLVLQAAAIAKGGEIFILDMGAPVKIVDLAKNMLKLYKKDDEIEIVFTGLRAGEKLYEELLIDDSEQKTRYESIHVARGTPYDIDELNRDISALIEAKDKVMALKKIVAEFNHRKG